MSILVKSQLRQRLPTAPLPGSSSARDEVYFIIGGMLLGAGLGGFFDGILLHQVLQWHHMFSNTGYSANDVSGLRFNVLLDGLFHVMTYLLVVAGLLLLWRATRERQLPWSSRALLGALLAGFGLFNRVRLF